MLRRDELNKIILEVPTSESFNQAWKCKPDKAQATQSKPNSDYPDIFLNKFPSKHHRWQNKYKKTTDFFLLIKSFAFAVIFQQTVATFALNIRGMCTTSRLIYVALGSQK